MDSFPKQFVNRTGKMYIFIKFSFPWAKVHHTVGNFLCNFWPCTLPVVVGENRVLRAPGAFIVAGGSLMGNFWAYLRSTHLMQYIPPHQQQGLSGEEFQEIFSIFLSLTFYARRIYYHKSGFQGFFTSSQTQFAYTKHYSATEISLPEIICLLNCDHIWLLWSPT